MAEERKSPSQENASLGPNDKTLKVLGIPMQPFVLPYNPADTRKILGHKRQIYFDLGFNDYVHNAMEPKDKEVFLESKKAFNRGTKYAGLLGLIAAISVRWVKIRQKSFLQLPVYFRWPIRLILLFGPLQVLMSSLIFQKHHVVQERLFMKYSKMDPQELQKKIEAANKKEFGTSSYFKALEAASQKVQNRDSKIMEAKKAATSETEWKKP